MKMQIKRRLEKVNSTLTALIVEIYAIQADEAAFCEDSEDQDDGVEAAQEVADSCDDVLSGLEDAQSVIESLLK